MGFATELGIWTSGRRLDGLEANTAALLVERDRLVAQMDNVEADIMEAQQAARACAAELER